MVLLVLQVGFAVACAGFAVAGDWLSAVVCGFFLLILVASQIVGRRSNSRFVRAINLCDRNVLVNIGGACATLIAAAGVLLFVWDVVPAWLGMGLLVGAVAGWTVVVRELTRPFEHNSDPRP